MGSLATIKAQIPALAHPATAGAAALAIDRSYRQLWADVHDLGTLLSLRQGLLARNMLYEGNAVAHIYKLLKSDGPCMKDPKVAAALLSILSALLTDVPAAFAAEGYGIHVHEVMDDGELIVPDTSELNAMRAQPLFVSLALNTLLNRPESSDHDPHVCVGYLNDLIAMDGVDYITSTAMQKLLDDQVFRESLFRGLASEDPHKVFKCLQILKRCIGGGPGMLRGFHSIHQALSPPWSLQKLLLLGAEQPLVTACNTVAHMVQEHAVERQLLGLLHTTLLDIFELLCVDDRRQSAGHRQQQQQQREQQSAAAPPAGADGDDSSTGCYWPDALVAAHVGLVVEVARLVPFLVTSISRMKPYSSSSAVCRALQHLGAGQSMSALVGVLDSGDPTDTLVLQQEIEAYQVLNAICQHDPQLALAALAAGAPRTVHSALVEWAGLLPQPSNDDLSDHHQDCVGPEHEDCSMHSDRSLPSDPSVHSENSGIFEVEGLGDQAAAAAAGSVLHSNSTMGPNFSEQVQSAASVVQIRGHRVVDPQIAAAVTAAMQLLLTLLRASASYCSSSSNSSSRSTSPATEAPAAATAVPVAAAAATGVRTMPASTAVSLSVLCKHQGLPQLLVELGQLEVFELLAIDCLVELDKLSLLPAAVKGLLDAALAAAAAAGASGINGYVADGSTSSTALQHAADGGGSSTGTAVYGETSDAGNIAPDTPTVGQVAAPAAVTAAGKELSALGGQLAGLKV